MHEHGNLDPLCTDIELFCDYLEKLLDGHEMEKLKKIEADIISVKAGYEGRMYDFWNERRDLFGAGRVLSGMQNVIWDIKNLLEKNRAPRDVLKAAEDMYQRVLRMQGALIGAKLKCDHENKKGNLTTTDAVLDNMMKDYKSYKLPAVEEVKNRNATRDMGELREKLEKATKAYTDLETKYTGQQKEVERLTKEVADLKKAASDKEAIKKGPDPKTEAVRNVPTKEPVKKPVKSGWFGTRKCLLENLEDLSR